MAKAISHSPLFLALHRVLLMADLHYYVWNEYIKSRVTSSNALNNNSVEIKSHNFQTSHLLCPAIRNRLMISFSASSMFKGSCWDRLKRDKEPWRPSGKRLQGWAEEAEDHCTQKQVPLGAAATLMYLRWGLRAVWRPLAICFVFHGTDVSNTKVLTYCLKKR